MPREREIRGYSNGRDAHQGKSSIQQAYRYVNQVQTNYVTNLSFSFSDSNCNNVVLWLILGELIGYTDLGDINAHLDAFERSIEEGCSSEEELLANSMLVLLVRGLFSQLKFPFAQFPCTALSGHQMLEPFWCAVCRLERCGFRVLALICDGILSSVEIGGNSRRLRVGHRIRGRMRRFR